MRSQGEARSHTQCLHQVLLQPLPVSGNLLLSGCHGNDIAEVGGGRLQEDAIGGRFGVSHVVNGACSSREEEREDEGEEVEEEEEDEGEEVEEEEEEEEEEEKEEVEEEGKRMR